MPKLRTIALLFALLFASSAMAQKTDTYVDEEECGCDLYFIDGIQKTYKDGKFGFKRYDGKILTPNKYIETDRFQNGYCKVWLDVGKCGLIDSTGREVIPCQYEDLDYFNCGLARFQQKYRFGFIDTANNIVIPATYVSASAFFENLAVVSVIIDSIGTLGYGFINTQKENCVTRCVIYIIFLKNLFFIAN